MIKDEKILTKITKSCELCSKRENCLEENCVLFRIEQILVEICKT